MSTRTAEAAEAGAVRCSRAGVFWRYWTASTVSRLGDQVTAVALPLVAMVTLHASAIQVGLITAATYVAWLLLGLPAGVLVVPGHRPG
ncbi:hypothetical protein [Kitasatospora sp. NPDC059599]|uniref:hypothetical protein n=1 Tax=Kitasatospora sp. NPDC059599 TaxID=3346880 RepID=UPI0036C5B3E2